MLNYDEPWGWMQPPRHALGALLLEQGHVVEAESVFRRDMDPEFHGRCHPDNIWALTGLAKCLDCRSKACGVEEGASIAAELKVLQSKLESLKEKADVDVSVACMCAGVGGSIDASPAKRRRCCGR